MTPRRQCDVLVFGGINTDFVVRGRRLPQPGASVDGDVFLPGPGGRGANAAVAATRLGARTAMIGRVGDDERGRALLAILGEEGVDAGAVSMDKDAPTGAAVINVDESGYVHVHDRATARKGARALIDRGVRAAVVGIDEGNLLDAFDTSVFSRCHHQ